MSKNHHEALTRARSALKQLLPADAAVRHILAEVERATSRLRVIGSAQASAALVALEICCSHRWSLMDWTHSTNRLRCHMYSAAVTVC